jgi:hypothetical protein
VHTPDKKVLQKYYLILLVKGFLKSKHELELELNTNGDFYDRGKRLSRQLIREPLLTDMIEQYGTKIPHVSPIKNLLN